MVNQKLFVRFLQVYAFQPATAFWRAVEVDILRKFLPESGTCLDLGCGDGKLTALLFEQSPTKKLTLIGIDADADETQRAAQFSFYTRIHTCPGSNIPEETGSMDYVISNSVLEHIQDIEATIAEVARLLNNGGRFVFTVPSPGFHRCLFGPLNQHASRQTYLEEMDQRLAHYRYWSTEEWRAILGKYGLEIETQREYFNGHEVRRWESISRFTAGILYALGGRKHAPIQVQKKLGLRQAQNALTLPAWVAAPLAKLLSAGVKATDDEDACLLICARKII